MSQRTTNILTRSVTAWGKRAASRQMTVSVSTRGGIECKREMVFVELCLLVCLSFIGGEFQNLCIQKINWF